jgi:uncharacterized repeat protein (TIGR03803 family)
MSPRRTQTVYYGRNSPAVQLAKGGRIMPSERRLTLLVAGCTLVFAFLTATPPLAAVTDKILWNFCSAGCQDGANPRSGLAFDAAGNMYGTTSAGGAYGCGAVFELARNRNDWGFTVLYSFACRADGDFPFGGLVLDSAGNLYGTTLNGGDCATDYQGCGTVFQLTPSKGNWTKKTLHTFSAANSKDGAYPYANLILDKTGNLYGTTAFGGAYGVGAVFKVSPKNGMWTEKVLHSFGNDNDGTVPIGPLIFDQAGTLYGTTTGGGAYEYGTVFELIPGTNGKWREKLLLSFDFQEDGCPTGGLIFDAAGNLYGTSGGAVLGVCNPGNVFQLTRGTNGKLKVLYRFGRSGDGEYPSAGLIFDAGGNLYGTTSYGGGGNGGGSGIVFKLSAKDEWKKEEVLHRFQPNGLDGTLPWAGSLILSTKAGKLYGTTLQGGKYGQGTIFEITP